LLNTFVVSVWSQKSHQKRRFAVFAGAIPLAIPTVPSEISGVVVPFVYDLRRICRYFGYCAFAGADFYPICSVEVVKTVCSD
jgi:hypothetical protein